jgi:hypothetical protein
MRSRSSGIVVPAAQRSFAAAEGAKDDAGFAGLLFDSFAAELWR